MSDLANPLQPGMPQAGAVAAAAPAASPVPMPTGGALASGTMRGRTQEQMLRRRDAAGDEMAMLAKIANDPNPTQKEVTDYIGKQVQRGHIPAGEAQQILATMPREPAALRQWARLMFSAVMHQGIHAEAAFPRELYPSAGQVPPQGQGTPPGPAAPATQGPGQ